MKIRVSELQSPTCKNGTHIRAGDFYIELEDSSRMLGLSYECIPCYENRIGNDTEALKRLLRWYASRKHQKNRTNVLLEWGNRRKKALALVAYNFKRREIEEKNSIIEFQCIRETWKQRLDRQREIVGFPYVEYPAIQKRRKRGKAK